MKTLTRNTAMDICSALSNISIGHFGDEELDIILANISALSKVEDDLRRLNEELNKRLYEGVDAERKQKCFGLLAKVDGMRGSLVKAKTADEAKKIVTEMDGIVKQVKDEYGDIWDIYQKHKRAYVRLLEKEIEVDIKEIDADVFAKAVLKGTKDIPMAELNAVFSPLFKEKEVEKTDDFSELEEVLN